jgi:hypothetical protein
MAGFVGDLSIAVVSKIVGIVAAVLLAAGLYWWFFIRVPTVDDVEFEQELDWRQEHLRKVVVGRAVDKLMKAGLPDRGVRGSYILLAPFRGDELEIRLAVQDALQRKGYNHGEVRLTQKIAKKREDKRAPAETPAEPEAPGFWDELSTRGKAAVLSLLPTIGSDADTPAEELPESLYIEGRVDYVDDQDGASVLNLELWSAPVMGKGSKKIRTEDTEQLITETARMSPNTVEYWRVFIQTTNSFLRLLAWLAVVGGLPWATAFLIRAAADTHSNGPMAGLVAGYTLIGLIAAWVLLGFTVGGAWGWSVLLLAVLAGGLYNFLVCDRLGEQFQD